MVENGTMDGGDAPASLFEGTAGVAMVLCDVSSPEQASLPSYQ